MSKLSQNNSGGKQGLKGNIIISSRNGIDYIRSRPETIHDPKTPGQLSQRRKFALINSIIRPLLPFIRIGFGSNAGRRTAYNAAISYNLKHALKGDPLNPEIDFEKLTFSRGTCPVVENAECRSVGRHSVQLSWRAEPIPARANPNDRIMAILYNETKRESTYFLQLALRSEGYVEVVLPAVYDGNTIHCYLSVMDISKAISGEAEHGISNSCYLGNLTLA